MEEMELQLPAGERSPEEQIISGEETRQIRKAVGRLPEKYRLPVLLFYMEDLKLSEISGVLKVPEGTVKSRLFKAKKLLRKELEVVLNEKKF